MNKEKVIKIRKVTFGIFCIILTMFAPLIILGIARGIPWYSSIAEPFLLLSHEKMYPVLLAPIAFFIVCVLNCALFFYFGCTCSGKRRIFYFIAAFFLALFCFYGSFTYLWVAAPFRGPVLAFKYHVMFFLMWGNAILWISCLEFFSRKMKRIYGCILLCYGIAGIAGSICYYFFSTPLFTPHGFLSTAITYTGIAYVILAVTGFGLLICSPKNGISSDPEVSG